VGRQTQALVGRSICEDKLDQRPVSVLLFLECLGGTARLIEPGGSEGGTLTQQHDEGIARKNQPMGDPEIRKTAAEMPSAGTCFSVSGFVRAAASKAADARRYLRSVGAGAARLSESSSIPRGKHARSPTSGPATMKNVGEKPPVYRFSPREIARHKCHGCGVNVIKIGHYCMLDSDLWERKLNLKSDDNMCIDCIEKHIGRPPCSRISNGGHSRRALRGYQTKKSQTKMIDAGAWSCPISYLTVARRSRYPSRMLARRVRRRTCSHRRGFDRRRRSRRRCQHSHRQTTSGTIKARWWVHSLIWQDVSHVAGSDLADAGALVIVLAPCPPGASVNSWSVVTAALAATCNARRI
jgi:hypothetical protein